MVHCLYIIRNGVELEAFDANVQIRGAVSSLSSESLQLIPETR